jgi:hypothetical protein
LVDRYARWATVRFSMPVSRASASADLSLDELGRLDELRRLEGVREVVRAGPQVAVHGDRRIIAHVGAALVRWGPVPEDLSVEIPDLEDALLGLLGGESGGDGEPGVEAAVPARRERPQPPPAPSTAVAETDLPPRGQR